MGNYRRQVARVTTVGTKQVAHVASKKSSGHWEILISSRAQGQLTGAFRVSGCVLVALDVGSYVGELEDGSCTCGPALRIVQIDPGCDIG